MKIISIYTCKELPLKQYIIRFFGKAIFIIAKTEKTCWVQLFGLLVCGRRVSAGLSFSQKLGAKRYFIVGGWIIQLGK